MCRIARAAAMASAEDGLDWRVFVSNAFELGNESIVCADRRCDGLGRGLRKPHANQKPLAYVMHGLGVFKRCTGFL